ncbi:MAG TPA: metallophosphoesterase family protein [bacterium]
MIKKSWLAFTIILFLIANIANAQVKSTASAIPDNIRLTWSESPKTTQTIGWRTDATIKAGKVQYGISGQIFTTVTAPAAEKLITNVGAIHLFSMTLRNLQPGTKYQYRVGDGTNWSGYYRFETERAETDKFEFIVFGDSHEKKPSYKVWQETVTQAYQQNPEAKFVMSVGDLIYAGKDYEQWQAWFAACQDVIANIPDMPAIGDHEPRGVSSKDEWQRPEYFVKLFKVPQNGPANFKGEVYSFDYGSAHIAVLNSSFHYEFADPTERQDMIDAEVAWLDADLAATTKPWKIVVYHDATYNLSADRAGTLTKVNFGPIIDKHHVDVVFNAHEHAMARSYFIDNENFVASAAKGTVYYISGRSGDNAKDSLGPKIWHSFFYDPQAQTCYLVVEVAKEKMTIKTRSQDGTLVDKFIINKEDPEENTPVVPFGAYQDVRFAAFGSLLQFGNLPEQNDAGEWFVDINALATFMTGSFDPATMVLSYDGGEIQLQLQDDMFLNESKAMVSLSGLISVGFYCKYHEAMNMVMVERWRD